MTPRSTTWILIALFAATFAGCTSDAERQREQQAQARRDIAQEDQDVQAKESHDEAVNARVLQEQEKLDAVEQKRSGNVYAHSCQHVTTVSMELNAVSVDKSQCSAGQLQLEQEAVKRQMFDKAFEEVRENNAKSQN